MDQSLSALSIEQALTTRRLGHPVVYLEHIGSTNDVVLGQAAAGAPEGLLVLAEEQTAGRGRQDRTWWAPPGSSLLMSLLLRPPIPAAYAAQLTMCLGLAAAEGVEQITGLRPGLKWPNDLLLDGRKLAGMLTELRLSGDQVAYAVLGLGLNVNLEFTSAELAPVAISLQMATGHPVERLPLLVTILERCETWYERLLAGESPHGAWSARLDTLGRRVVISMPDGNLEGLAVGVNAQGALLVQADDGQVNTVWAGDVSSLRNRTLSRP
jgi:BirA family transcriptional regulator, biotin operon repressor / biotin---[acetyl-CoA-carboxylase] ligase